MATRGSCSRGKSVWRKSNVCRSQTWTKTASRAAEERAETKKSSSYLMEFKQKTLWKVEPRAYQIRWRSTWRRRRRPEKAPTIRRLYGCAPYLGNENPPNLLPPPHGLFLPSHCLSAAVQKSQHFCTEQEKKPLSKKGGTFLEKPKWVPSFFSWIWRVSIKCEMSIFITNPNEPTAQIRLETQSRAIFPQ